MLAAATSRLAPRLARGAARAQLHSISAPGARAMSSEVGVAPSEAEDASDFVGSDLKPSEVRRSPGRHSYPSCAYGQQPPAQRGRPA